MCARVQEMKQHIKTEEGELLPKLKGSPGMTQERLEELGQSFADAGMIAPTR